MSAVYKRGPRCGVDNCKSRYYQLVDGQRVCRNGHVLVGDYEVGEDEDDYAGPTGRRMLRAAQTELQSTLTADSDMQFYGKVGMALFMQCLQVLLRTQVEWIVQSSRVVADGDKFERVVKELFGMYVNHTRFSKVAYSHVEYNRDFMGPKVKRRDDESDDDNDEGDKNEGVGEAESEAQRINQDRVKLPHTILLVYLACVLLRLPIYLYDFNRWIYRYEMPYMNAMQYLPEEMRKRLPIYYIHAFTPKNPPLEGQLHSELMALLYEFNSANGLTFPPQPQPPLLFKIIHDLFLPPEVYYATQLLTTKLNIDMMLPVQSSSSTPFYTKIKLKYVTPEVKLVCATVVAVRICFGLDNRERVAEDDSAAMFPVDWQVWNNMLQKVWVQDESLSEADERDVLFWDKDKVERYLGWFEQNFIHKRDSDASMATKRLYDLFPMGHYSNDGSVVAAVQGQTAGGASMDDNVVGSPTPVAKPIPSTVGEIYQYVHRSTTEVLPDHRDLAKPGQEYWMANPGEDKTTELITTLYQTAARLCAVKPSTIHAVCAQIEKQLGYD